MGVSHGYYIGFKRKGFNMSKVIIKGIKEDGLIDAERKSTAVLVTELIERLPKMCEADVCKALEEIRLSAEQDTRMRQTYLRIIRERNNETEENHEA